MPGGVVKLSDFGLSVEVDKDTNTYQGQSLADMGVKLNMSRRAPELMASEPAGARLSPAMAALTGAPALDEFAVDVWSLGVLTYQLLTGDVSPFARAGKRKIDEAEEKARILRGDHELSALIAPRSALSRRQQLEAEHLLNACLQRDPRRRPTAAAALAHPLLWSDAEVASRIRALQRDSFKEKELEAALKAAGLSDSLYHELRDWNETQRPAGKALISAAQKRVRGKPGSGGAYRNGMQQLVRFARNVLEHMPTDALKGAEGAQLWGEAMGAPLDTKSVDALGLLVVARLLEVWPALPLAVYVCGGGGVAGSDGGGSSAGAPTSPAAAPRGERKQRSGPRPAAR